MIQKISALLLCMSLLSLHGQTSGFDAKVERILSAHQGAVEYVQFHPTKNIVASAGHDETIVLWNLDNATVGHYPLVGHTNIINHIEFNRVGNLLASASNDGTIRLWDTNTRDLKKTIANAPAYAIYKEAYFAVFSPDERYIYFGGKNKKISRALVEGGDNTAEVIYKTPTNQREYDITVGICSPDRQYLVFASGNSIFFMDWGTHKIEKVIKQLPDYVNDLRFSNNGLMLSAWCENGKMFFWDYPSLENKTAINAGNEGYSHIAYNAESTVIASGNVGSSIRLWNTKTKQQVGELNKHSKVVTTMAFHPTDNNVLLSGSYDGNIILWNLQAVTEDEVVATPPKLTIEQPSKTENTPVKINNRLVTTTTNMTMYSNTVSLFIWDEKKIDGDVVSIYLNGEEVLANYTLEAAKKEIKLELKPDEPNILALYAINLGYEPPNTAAVSIFDGQRSRKITLSSDLQKCEAINLIYNSRD